ncbi:MAG TPA: hypothetical protein DCS67_03735 [Clostridiales bacterium UBA8960]|jgi:cell division protein ZapA (FtsZ GTPase activity inhibitor)|nr:hypothetical protein [Clostridiales bacterium UBA8960]
MSNHEFLNHVIQFAPMIATVALRDTAVAVTDLERYLHYTPGIKLNHKVKAGDLLKPGSLVDKAMKNGEKSTAVADASLFGVPYVGTAIPIFDPVSREVIGSLFIGESTENQELLKNMSKELSDHVSEISTFTKDISGKAEVLSEFSSKLSELTLQFNAKIAEINSVTGIIKTIANKSNMLGINAAIESARIGEMGRGFAVVAEEISKLAKQSADSVVSIASMAGEIMKDSDEIKTESGTMSQLSGEINGILGGLSQNVESIYGMVEELYSLSESM